MTIFGESECFSRACVQFPVNAINGDWTRIKGEEKGKHIYTSFDEALGYEYTSLHMKNTAGYDPLLQVGLPWPSFLSR